MMTRTLGWDGPRFQLLGVWPTITIELLCRNELAKGDDYGSHVVCIPSTLCTFLTYTTTTCSGTTTTCIGRSLCTQQPIMMCEGHLHACVSP